MNTDIYDKYWHRIKQLAPNSVKLREPGGELGGGDLDILVKTDEYNVLKDFLTNTNFNEEFSSQPFCHTWRLRKIEFPTPITIDIYTELMWGPGIYSKAQKMDEATSQKRMRLMRAIYDKKSKAYFEKMFHLDDISNVLNAMHCKYFNDWLWKKNMLTLLRISLLVTGIVSVKWRFLLKSIKNIIADRIRQLIYKRGLEVSFIGVDGTGKTMLTQNLKKILPLPVKSIYMGDNCYLTWPIQWLVKKDNPYSPAFFLASHLEMVYRRLKGFFWSKRGYVVLYDRHPVEKIRLNYGWKAVLNNSFAVLYNVNLDLSIMLTGDLDTIQKRKNEHPTEKLKELEANIVNILTKYKINYFKIDSVENNEIGLANLIGNMVIANYVKRRRKMG